MKKIANLMLGLTAAMAFTACSSTEDVTAPGAAKGDVTVTVVTNDALLSRAGIATVNGYDFQCTMQLVSDAGDIVGTQDVKDASAGTVSFTIKAEDIDAGATKAIFWAGYTSADATKNVYSTADLTNITYAVTEFDMTNADLLAAADAFAGALTTLENGAKVTLTRPMIQFNFKPSNPETAAGANKLVVTYDAPSAYNVLTSNCTAAANQKLTYTNAAFNPEATGNWFTSLIFAPANLTKFDKEIEMTLTGTNTQTLTIPANTLPMDANYIVNTTAEITAAEDQNLNVDVTINGSYENEPKPAVFEVGAYLDATGKPVSTKEEAVAIVFYAGALTGDDASLYPAEFAGKTIKGYAVGLDNAVMPRQQFNAANITDGLTPCEDLINGSVNTPALLTALGSSAFVTNWNNWTAANEIKSAGATTAWYIPSRFQFEAWISMLLNTTSTNGDAITASGTEAFKAMFPLSTLFDRCTDGVPSDNCMYATCSVNNGGNIQGGSFKASDTSVSFSQVDIKTKTQKVLCRAMITIFE